MYSDLPRHNGSDIGQIETIKLVYLAANNYVYEAGVCGDYCSGAVKLGCTITEVVRNVGFKVEPHLFQLCCEHLDVEVVDGVHPSEIKSVLPETIHLQRFWLDQRVSQRIKDLGYSRAETEEIWEKERLQRVLRLEEVLCFRSRYPNRRLYIPEFNREPKIEIVVDESWMDGPLLANPPQKPQKRKAGKNGKSRRRKV
jgi:hypothetical protein